MAKGSEAKEAITRTILDTFQGSFKYDKEIRIPYQENGEQIQIKVTLTCAKVNVENGDEEVSSLNTEKSKHFSAFDLQGDISLSEPTEEEKARLADLVSKLNL